MLFRKSRSGGEIAPGGVYRRIENGRLVDTARVLALLAGPNGIPHVRFSVHHERTETGDEERTLSLATFHQMFSHEVRIGPA